MKLFLCLSLAVLGISSLALAKQGTPQPKPQSLKVSVDAGFHPSVLRAKSGKPIHLVFVAKHVACAKIVKFASLGLKVDLVDGKETAVDIPAQKKGAVLDYACSMDMYKGQIVFK